LFRLLRLLLPRLLLRSSSSSSSSSPSFIIFFHFPPASSSRTFSLVHRFLSCIVLPFLRRIDPWPS
jgi:hypothetical protein